MKKILRKIRSLALLLAILAGTPTAYAFEFQGFGDVTFSDATSLAPINKEQPNGAFALGQFDLYVSKTLTDRLQFLSEIVISGKPGGEFAVTLQRLQIGYIVSDELKVRVGRFHNLLGYWNLAFHHGTQIQTTIERPVFLRFEYDRGILPVHAVGIWVGGRYRIPSLAVQYGLMVANGDTTFQTTLDPNNVGDNNPNKQISLQLRVNPSRLPGFGIGVSGNFGKVQGDLLTGEVSQQIYSGDLEYTGRSVEFLSEYYAVRNREEREGTHTSPLYFVQFGLILTDRLIPYSRYERMSIQEGDPYFAALRASDLEKTLVGLRYNLTPESSLKAEVQWIDPTTGDRFLKYAAQWAFEF